MNRVATLLLLIVLFAVGCAMTTLTLRPTIDTTAQALTNHALAPDPLADVLAVRNQAMDQSSAYGWLLALLLLAGLAIAAALVAMGRFPKMVNAWRRMKRPYSQHQQRRPFQPLPQQTVNDLPMLPRPPIVQPVPDWTDGMYD